MHLEEGVLKHVVGQRRIAREPGEEVEQLAPISRHQGLECLVVAVKMTLEQRFIPDSPVVLGGLSHWSVQCPFDPMPRRMPPALPAS